jgi:hypothetical protein
VASGQRYVLRRGMIEVPDRVIKALRGFETVSGSQIRRRGLRRRRERVQTEDPRHWRRLRAPRAPQSQDQGGHGREGVAIDLPQVDCSTCPTTRAEHVEPRRFCDQRSSDRRRPQYVTAGSKLLVPALDDCFRLGARRRRQLAAWQLWQCPGPASERPSRSILGTEPSIQPMPLVSIREAAVLHALLDIGAPDFRALAPWYVFVHLPAARGAGWMRPAKAVTRYYPINTAVRN